MKTLIKLMTAFWLKNFAVMYLNDTGTISNQVQDHYDNTLLLEANPKLFHTLFARKASTIPKGKGTKITFIRINSLPDIITPNTEGVDPASQEWGKTEVTAEADEYVAIIVNSTMKFESEADVVTNGLARAMSRQAGRSRNAIAREVINGGTGVTRGGGVAARTDIVTKVTKVELQKLQRTLSGNDAEKITGYVPAGNSANEPLSPCYPVFVHTDLEMDIGNIDGFVPIAKYAQNAKIMPGEFGKFETLRFLSSSTCKVWADGGGAVGTTGLKSTSGTKVDVYSILAIGEEATGYVPLMEGENAKMILKDKTQAGSKADLYSSMAWKMYIKDVILNDLFLHRLEVGVTA